MRKVEKLEAACILVGAGKATYAELGIEPTLTQSHLRHKYEAIGRVFKACAVGQDELFEECNRILGRAGR